MTDKKTTEALNSLKKAVQKGNPKQATQAAHDLLNRLIERGKGK